MKYSHLPHIHLANHYQFITFRTHDSLDAYVKKLQSQYKNTQKQQYAIDQYLDRSPKGAYLNNETLILLSSYLKKSTELYDLDAFALIPNHVHLLIKPNRELSKVINQVKGSSSARLINEARGTKGKFWAKDYYDKLIRDENHYKIVYEYIRNNPLVLGDPKGSHPRFYGIHG